MEHERVLEGPQAQGARRCRTWLPQEVAGLLGISLSTISRYVKLKASGSEIASKPSPGRKAKISDSPAHKRALWRQLEGNDTATLEEHCEMLEKERGISVSAATMSRAVRKLG